MEKIYVFLAGGFHSGWQDVVIDAVQRRSVSAEFVFLDPRQWQKDKNKFALNLMNIICCDVLFANLEKDNPSGVGLANEIGAAAALGKIVIFVNEKEDKYFKQSTRWADITVLDLVSGISELCKLR